MTRMNLYVLVFIGLMALPFKSFAHGTDYRLLANDAVVAVEFIYSDKTPMQYSEILVFSPENQTVEYQNGRTDQMGRFAFLPETPGEWKLKVSDGMGHAVHAAVTVSPHKSDVNENGETSEKGLTIKTKTKASLLEGVPVVIKIVLGLSLLLNFFLAMYMRKRQA